MTKLETITAEDLQNRTYEPTRFLVDELIPEGLHILAGAPKIGKSWLALWLCLCVSQGQPLWNFASRRCEIPERPPLRKSASLAWPPCFPCAFGSGTLP